MGKGHKFDGIWDVRRVLYNVLSYADEEGCIKYVAGDAESTDGIKRQRLTARYGKGYTYTAVTRMMKVARFYSDEEMFATLSQTLTWSHFLRYHGTGTCHLCVIISLLIAGIGVVSEVIFSEI